MSMRSISRMGDPADFSTFRIRWSQALFASALPDRSKIVGNVMIFALVNRMDGMCIYSHAAIASHVSKSTDTVKRAIRDLEAANFIVVERRIGRGWTCRYRFTIPEQKGAEPDLFPSPETGAALHHFRPPEKGGRSAKKGAGLPEKGGRSAPALKKPKELSKKVHTETEPSSAPGRSAVSAELEAAVFIWNEMAARNGLPGVQKLTSARRRKLGARLRDAGGIDGWRAAIEKVAGSDFLCGRIPGKSWRASFDFILDETKFAKVMEDSYAKRNNLDRDAGREVDLFMEYYRRTDAIRAAGTTQGGACSEPE